MKFIIALVLGQNGNKWSVLGYKILDLATGEFKLLSESTIKNLNLKLKNAEFIDGTLKGTMGDLKRYTKLNAFDGYPIEGSSIVILGKDSEGYFLCVEDPAAEENLIHRLTPFELKRKIKMDCVSSNNILVANARVDNPDNIKEMVIRPIKGTFEVIKQCKIYKEKDFDFGKKQEYHSSKWKVRIVKKGEKYGRDYSLVNERETIIEFYDLDVNLEKFPIGQFVASYYLSDIKDRSEALNLNGVSDKWFITRDSLKDIQEWLEFVII